MKEGGKGIGEIDAYPEAGEPPGSGGARPDTLRPWRVLEQGHPGQGDAFRGGPGLF